MNVIDELRQAAETLRERVATQERLAEWLEREAHFDETYIESGALDVARLINGGAA